MSEMLVIHPQVHQWLIDNGYEVRHEVPMPQYGRADFVATRGDETLVIECKQRFSISGMRQVLDYASQTGHKPMLAAPQGTLNEKVIDACSKRGVAILPVEDTLATQISGDFEKDVWQDYRHGMRAFARMVIEEYQWAMKNNIEVSFDACFAYCYLAITTELMPQLTDQAIFSAFEYLLKRVMAITPGYEVKYALVKAASDLEGMLFARRDLISEEEGRRYTSLFKAFVSNKLNTDGQ